jgi:hypothetical protein
MKKIFLFLFAIYGSINLLSAQSMVGAWRTISNVIEDLDGTKSDIVPKQTKMYPCIADLQTIFDANGKQYFKSPKNDCDEFVKLPGSTWKMNGKTLSLTNTKVPTPLGTTSTFTVDFIGDKAILTKEYSADERAKMYKSKAKKITITYQRV